MSAGAKHTLVVHQEVACAAEQKFADLTNRVEMLESELIAMKLCKLKMEADKTQVELHAKQMEKTLSALQAAHSATESQVSVAPLTTSSPMLLLLS